MRVLPLVANALAHSHAIAKAVDPLSDYDSASAVIGVSASTIMTMTPAVMIAVTNRNANILGVCNSEAAG